MNENKNINISLLLDIYGPTLPKVQYDSLDLYYNEDLSLAEIADNTGKTRQGVYDAIKRGESSLNDMESNLGFWEKIEGVKDQLDSIKKSVSKAKNKIRLDPCESEKLCDLALKTLNKIKF